MGDLFRLLAMALIFRYRLRGRSRQMRLVSPRKRVPAEGTRGGSDFQVDRGNQCRSMNWAGLGSRYRTAFRVTVGISRRERVAAATTADSQKWSQSTSFGHNGSSNLDRNIE